MHAYNLEIFRTKQSNSRKGGCMRRAFFVLAFLIGATPAWAQDGGALYAQHCGRCHDLGLPRTPSRSVLRGLPPEQIVSALESGTMRAQGAERTAPERRAIASFLTGKAVGDTPPPPPLRMCAAGGSF